MTRLFFILSVFLPMLLFGQEGYSGKPKKKLYEIYEFGLWFNPGSNCENEIRKKYGFKTIGGGCLETKGMLRHNERAERLLLKYNGSNWRTRYSDEIKRCGTVTSENKSALCGMFSSKYRYKEPGGTLIGNSNKKSREFIKTKIKDFIYFIPGSNKINYAQEIWNGYYPRNNCKYALKEMLGEWQFTKSIRRSGNGIFKIRKDSIFIYKEVFRPDTAILESPDTAGIIKMLNAYRQNKKEKMQIGYELFYSGKFENNKLILIKSSYNMFAPQNNKLLFARCIDCPSATPNSLDRSDSPISQNKVEDLKQKLQDSLDILEKQINNLLANGVSHDVKLDSLTKKSLEDSMQRMTERVEDFQVYAKGKLTDIEQQSKNQLVRDSTIYYQLLNKHLDEIINKYTRISKKIFFYHQDSLWKTADTFDNPKFSFKKSLLIDTDTCKSYPPWVYYISVPYYNSSNDTYCIYSSFSMGEWGGNTVLFRYKKNGKRWKRLKRNR